MTFSNGQYQLDLNWRPADSHERYVADRATSAKPPRQVTVYGQAAVQFLYDYVGSTDFTTLWLDGSHSFEARGVLPDRASYEAVMAGLAPVDIDTWLKAMPESVVKPANRAPVIAAMLHDIPQPDSFDVAELTAAGVVRDRYQLGARVTGEIACQWIEQWLDARAVGDTAAASAAVDAMRTARNWSILIEMSESGAYHEVLWKYADIIASAGTADREVAITVQQSYQAALCHQRD